jgi:TrmH RNA methyltransferase
MTDAEHRLWKELRSARLLDAKFRRQEPIGKYIADFVSFEHRLVVEADGGQHVENPKDVARDRWFESQGFRVLRFWNDEVLTRTEDVLERIASMIGERTLTPTPLPSRERGSAHGEPQRRSEARPGRETSAEKPLSPGGRGVGVRGTYGAEKPQSPTKPETRETRLHGLNACRAAFAARPQDLRKVYLSEARIGALRDVLAWCVKHRLGYRVVEDADLQKLAASSHHEGVIFEMRERVQPTLTQALAALPDGPQVLLWLDGVGNPHNFGALLRSAAHFGVTAVLLPPESPLTLSGAGCRVAEGGAEAVAVVRTPSLVQALQELREAGFVLAATLPAGGESIYAAALPPRVVLVFGAEGGGMQPALIDACRLRLSIPGTGRVESLNIANAVGVMLGECWRRHAR